MRKHRAKVPALIRNHAIPLDAGLNAAIMSLAPQFTVQLNAPDTLAGVLASPDIVYAGGSDATIYGDRVVNWAFRAWHDAAHAQGLHDFSLAGERATCEAQCLHLALAYPRAPRRWFAIIRAEVNAQSEYYQRTGQFPKDQFEFIRANLGG